MPSPTRGRGRRRRVPVRLRQRLAPRPGVGLPVAGRPGVTVTYSLAPPLGRRRRPRPSDRQGPRRRLAGRRPTAPAHRPPGAGPAHRDAVRPPELVPHVHRPPDVSATLRDAPAGRAGGRCATPTSEARLLTEEPPPSRRPSSPRTGARSSGWATRPTTSPPGHVGRGRAPARGDAGRGRAGLAAGGRRPGLPVRPARRVRRRPGARSG